MAEITLVRRHDITLTEQERAIARRAVFEAVDGLGERNQRKWRRLWNRIWKLEPGEAMNISTNQERLGWYHRKHMALEQRVFEAQERFEVFAGFRTWLKTGAGFVTWFPGPKGGVIPVVKSISYAKLEQGEMEVFHADAVRFLRTAHAQKTLWPHLAPIAAAEMMETILEGFGE
ncbi:hypothetical protein [Castellaniella sp. UC4442_H9]